MTQPGEIQTLTAKFAALWDQPPDVFRFLQQQPPASAAELLEVILVDHSRRWARGLALPVERYLQSFPQLADDSELALRLLVAEYEHRFQQSSTLSVRDFAADFPRWERALIARLEGEPPTRISEETPAPTVIADDLDFQTMTISLGRSDHHRAAPRKTEPADSGSARFLASHFPFSTLPAHVVEIIAPSFRRTQFEAGEYLLRQGDAGDSLMVIQDGVVEISTDDQYGRHFIGRIGPGQVLGEMSLLTDEPRSANALAVEPVSVLTMAADTFHQLACRYPVISMVLTRLVATRLGGMVRDVLAGKTLEGYRFERQLGQGGMSVVYQATEAATNRAVALKMMSHRLVYDAIALQRFQREADLIEQLQHENIVQMLGRFRAFHTYFIVMEYCDGQSLDAVLRNRRGLHEAEIRKILGQVVRALTYAHAAGIVHRDIKPANIMLNTDGTVKLADFGLAKPVADSELDRAEPIVGTPRYMSPEQILGRVVGPETDLFSLGCTLYRMMTGRFLFEERDLNRLRNHHMTWQAPAFNELRGSFSGELVDLLQTCVQHSPAARRFDPAPIARWGEAFDRKLLIAAEADSESSDHSLDTLVE